MKCPGLLTIALLGASLSLALLSPRPASAAGVLTVGSNSSSQTTNFTSGINPYTGIFIGYNTADSNNTISVLNANTVLTNSGSTAVGVSGRGNSLTISGGGLVQDIIAYVGDLAASSNNTALVTGAGSTWSNSGTIYLGYQGSGNSLTISNTGVVQDSIGIIGNIATATNNSVLVTGTGSTWSNSSTLYVGVSGKGNSLTISGGGLVQNASGLIGSGVGATNNSVLVTGNGSTWSNSGTLTVANSGSGTITVARGAEVVANSIHIATAAGSIGTLNIGTLGGSDTAGTLITPTITFGSGTGKLNFNQSDIASVTSTISGAGTIQQLGSGTTILTGNNSYSGATSVNGGTLLLNGVTSGAGQLRVNSGTLGGTGSFAGGFNIIASGANLTPGASGSGTLTLNNALLLNTGSTTTFSINATSAFTSINLGANQLTYGGALVFNIGGSYLPATSDTFSLFGSGLTSGTESGNASSVDLSGLLTANLIFNGTSDWLYTTNSLTYDFSQTTGTLAIIISTVPEPASFVLLGLGTLALLIAARRKRAV